MNRENIKRVRDVIAGLPDERFDMAELYQLNGVYVEPREYGPWTTPGALLHRCGTAACIAGWTVALLTPRARVNWDAGAAARLLGLGEDGACALFTPAHFDRPGHYTRAHAVRVLDRLLETGEVDWEGTRETPAAQP